MKAKASAMLGPPPAAEAVATDPPATLEAVATDPPAPLAAATARDPPHVATVTATTAPPTIIPPRIHHLYLQMNATTAFFFSSSVLSGCLAGSLVMMAGCTLFVDVDVPFVATAR